jgi:hypothetical protein
VSVVLLAYVPINKYKLPWYLCFCASGSNPFPIGECANCIKCVSLCHCQSGAAGVDCWGS